VEMEMVMADSVFLVDDRKRMQLLLAGPFA
jgi:hypothetical protein